MEETADALRQHPERQRAAKIEPEREGVYVAAVAVRTSDGIATAILTDIRTDDPFLLAEAMARACEVTQ